MNHQIPLVSSGCYECGRECINDAFCRDDTISLPKRLKFKVTANPTFWGFNDGSGNVLIEGWSFFENGRYDFFDGFNEHWTKFKTCGATVTGPFIDEQRPDVLYRSVYDPEDPLLSSTGGKRHYGVAGAAGDIERGGAEPYLIDRVAGQLTAVTSDNSSCDTTNPLTVYKKTPENFGFGTKLSTTDKVFKNITGAWRLVTHSGCYPILVTNSGLASECDGTAKQSITPHRNFSSEYDPFRIRPSGATGCHPDGSTPAEYAGTLTTLSGVYRPSGVTDFLKARLQYGALPASGIQSGGTLWIEASGYSSSHVVFDVSHTATYTEVKLVGTLASGAIVYNSGSWISFETYDPASCCGGAAYNVSNTTKRLNNISNYHTDVGRIFNNSKNILQSNRLIANRYDYGIGSPAVFQTGVTARYDKTYPSVTSTGVLMAGGHPVFERKLPYYGPFYEVDSFDTAIRRDEQQNTTQGNNATCYSKVARLEVFPDCVTQYKEYNECVTNTVKYLTNQVSRLGLVYRGCDFQENCSYDASGRPISGWSGGAPQNIGDLRRGLAGQEIYMYINLSDAWGSIIKTDPCLCIDPPPGSQPPDVVMVPSPVTFPNFPKFDLYPSGYGCKEPMWQLKFAYECEGAPIPICIFPSSQYACMVRQPYTTYGFMRNLCGKESDDKRKVITNGMSSIISAGSYRNTNSSGTNVPMHWEFNNPYSHDVLPGGGFSSSGNYPYWGLSDSTGRLVAPYFNTKPGTLTTLCDTGVIDYKDFNLCGTRASGWPTTNVPFLVEIDHDDDCVGCASALMPNGNLVLETQGLSTAYSHARGEKYGWNHCRYKGTAEDPIYTCASGFGVLCSGSAATGIDLVGATSPYIGSTCGCTDTSSFSLRHIPLRGSDIGLGWSTWNNKNSYIRVNGCAQSYDNDFFQPIPYLDSYGFSIYASYKLSCDGMHNYLQPVDSGGSTSALLAANLLAGNSTPLDNLYENTSCSRHFPSAGSDLVLKAGYIAVPSGNESLFELIPESMLAGGMFPSISLQGSKQDVLDDLAAAHVFGCDTYLYEYGCKSVDSYGVSGFFPCGNCKTGTATPLCSCARIGCNSCSGLITVDGSPANQIPIEYQNGCFCDCSIGLMRITKTDASGTETITYSASTGVCQGSTIAYLYSGIFSTTPLTYLSDLSTPFAYGPSIVTAETACSWHTGPNMTATGVYYEFQNPERLSLGSLQCETLDPSTCTGTCANDSTAQNGSCGDPIPWLSGIRPVSGVLVTKRSCFPEIMIVNKIVCSGMYYNLYVSREYHTHGRAWEYAALVGSPPVATCLPKQKGAWRAIPSGNCVSIPTCTPSDSVTPAYYSEQYPSTGAVLAYRGVCSAHYSSGIWKNQDFQYDDTVVPPATGRLWNYFNLFYKENFPTAEFIDAIQVSDGDLVAENCHLDGTTYTSGTIFTTGQYLTPANRYGIDWTNKFHSCLQDHQECGGDFYCNKMFFPRRKYAVGTKITKFGSLQLCTSHADLSIGDWYTGYESFGNSLPSVLDEAENTKFIDGCDESIKALTVAEIGLDDVIITVNDYLPLVGINASLFRYNLDSKSCTIISSGNCPILGTHSSLTIDQGIHTYKVFPTDRSDTMGYYLDKYTAVQADNCLFKPFKILMDVECCNSNIRRKSKQYDPPTMLEYVVDGAPSWACGGFVKPVPCVCGDSVCGDVLGYHQLAPTPICVTISVATPSYNQVSSTGMNNGCPTSDCTTCCAASGVLRPTAFIGIATDGIGVFNGTADPITHVVGSSAGVPVGCAATCGRGIPIVGSIMRCSGDALWTNQTITTYAYECQDHYYIPATLAFVDNTGCCPNATLCTVLGNSWKVTKGGCKVLRTSNKGNHIADYLNGCGCISAVDYEACDTSVISATITEA